MRTFSLLILLFLITVTSSRAQEPNPADVNSIDGIIAALYDVISGPAGSPRDWDRFHSLLLPETRLIPIGRDSTGETLHRTFSGQEYMEATRPYFDTQSFYEVEINRVEERYGNMVHAFSSYESYRSLEDAAPFARGINSIQVLFEDERWWILTVFWQPEWPGLPLPEQYLPQ